MSGIDTMHLKDIISDSPAVIKLKCLHHTPSLRQEYQKYPSHVLRLIMQHKQAGDATLDIHCDGSMKSANVHPYA